MFSELVWVPVGSPEGTAPAVEMTTGSWLSEWTPVRDPEEVRNPNKRVH